MDALQSIQPQIYDIDKKIVELLQARAALVSSHATLGRGALAPQQEREMLRNAQTVNNNRLPKNAIERIMREIISVCRAEQQPSKVVFLGPSGTFSEQAATAYFGSSIISRPKGTLQEVFAAVKTGVYAVVPVENTLAGVVQESIDLLHTHKLKVVDTVDLQIEQCLLGKTPALEEITHVFSHAMSLKQCHNWLGQYLPHATLEAVSSNAEGMRLASVTPNSAAIGSEMGSKYYNISIIRRNLHDSRNNITRFAILGSGLQ